MSELFSEQTFFDLFEIEDDILREQRKAEIRQDALAMHKAREFDKLYKLYYADYKRLKMEQNPSEISRVRQKLACDEYGKVKKTRENFLLILQNDPYFENYFLLNEFTDGREFGQGKKARPYTDANDAQVRYYIETNYGLSDSGKTDDAITMMFESHRYHPIRETIEAIHWDGKPRIRDMLHKYLGAADDAYTRDVSRLIFHAGILRLYEPGCKADLMPVLIGRQGEGKSTFVRMLAIKDDWFREIGEFEGQRGMEALEGGFICEVSELLALKRTKEAAAVKSYLTRQYDNYRKPYAKYPVNNPRKCIFIGTTNTEQFIGDPTGGRRYLPVKISEGHIWEDIEAFKQDIEQCWAEAYADYIAGKASAVETPELLPVIRMHQEDAKEDDWRIGAIEEYLEDKRLVCVKQIWEEALKMNAPPTKRDSMEIATLMQGFGEWEKKANPTRIQNYGLQKVWEKKMEFNAADWDDI